MSFLAPITALRFSKATKNTKVQYRETIRERLCPSARRWTQFEMPGCEHCLRSTSKIKITNTTNQCSRSASTFEEWRHHPALPCPLSPGERVLPPGFINTRMGTGTAESWHHASCTAGVPESSYTKLTRKPRDSWHVAINNSAVKCFIKKINRCNPATASLIFLTVPILT